MAFSLPSNIGFNAVDWRLTDAREMTRSELTGTGLIVDRGADIWTAKLVLPTMTADEAAPWEAAFLRARTEAFFLSPQLRDRPFTRRSAGTSPGTPLVEGGGQTGTTLSTDGWTTGFAIKAGDYISFSNGTFEELHMILEDVTATGGAADLHLAPPIKISPANNAVIRWDGPRAEMVVAAGQNFVTQIGAGLSVSLEIEVEELL